MIIVGTDPDAKAHGIAVYINGQLEEIKELTLIEVMQLVDMLKQKVPSEEILFSIEDVKANSFVYARNNKGNKAVTSKIAMAIGKNQQAQVELERMLEHMDIRYELHKPQRGNWAKNKAQFMQVTGWTKQSNADTRSAAFMGWLALK